MLRGVTLLVAMAAVAGALGQTVNVTITPTQDLSHVELAYVQDGSSLNLGQLYDAVDLPNVTANTTYSSTVSLPGALPLPVLYYSIFAVYTNGSNQGATIGFSTAAGTALINSNAPWPFAPIDETQWISSSILAYYKNLDQVELMLQKMEISTGGSLLPAVPGDQGQLVNFSNGTNGGTMTLTVVPEPAGLFGLGLGVIALVRRRKPSRPS